MEDALTFVLALRHLPSVGRVTAGRLGALAGTLGELRRIPREQVLLRLKGTPHAADLVRTLHDDAAMAPVLAAAQEEAEALARRGVGVHAPRLPPWPTGLDRLERRDRPALLFSYGRADVLLQPGVAFFGAPGLDPEAFEHAQRLLPALAANGLMPVLALATGFDVVMAKIATSLPVPALAVFGCGLARVPPPMRPHALGVTRTGGAMVSPFEMEHGPFPHDEAERARVQVALARAVVVFSAAPGGPEARALKEAQALGIPTYTPAALSGTTTLLTDDAEADAAHIAAVLA